jgi:Heme oxygenase
MLLLAHLYTQESALLAGGQMIRCVLRCASSSQLAPWTTQLPGTVATPDSICARKQIRHCRRMARKAMQLPDGRGTSVFDFAEEVCLSCEMQIMQLHHEASPTLSSSVDICRRASHSCENYGSRPSTKQQPASHQSSRHSSFRSTARCLRSTMPLLAASGCRPQTGRLQ